MSTKISALPAATAINVTDATVLPLVDGTTTTVKVTVAQLRTQLNAAAQTWFGAVTAVGAVHSMQTTNGTTAFTDVSTTTVVAQITGNAGKGAYLTLVETTIAARWAIGYDGGSSTLQFRNGNTGATAVASLSSAGLFTTTTLQVNGNSTFTGSMTIPSVIPSLAGAGTDIVFGATTQTTVGAAGVASVLPGPPLGYLVFYRGATKCVLPYYNG